MAFSFLAKISHFFALYPEIAFSVFFSKKEATMRTGSVFFSINVTLKNGKKGYIFNP